jgi:hypothetical protein
MVQLHERGKLADKVRSPTDACLPSQMTLCIVHVINESL